MGILLCGSMPALIHRGRGQTGRGSFSALSLSIDLPHHAPGYLPAEELQEREERTMRKTLTALLSLLSISCLRHCMPPSLYMHMLGCLACAFGLSLSLFSSLSLSLSHLSLPTPHGLFVPQNLHGVSTFVLPFLSFRLLTHTHRSRTDIYISRLCVHAFPYL